MDCKQILIKNKNCENKFYEDLCIYFRIKISVSDFQKK